MEKGSTLRQWIRRYRQSRKKYWVTAALLALVLGLGIYSYRTGRGKEKLVYADSLDLVAATVNGQPLTLRELAFYVVYEENQVEEQAKIYNEDNTAEYWNKRTDHTYIRSAARNAAIQMAIHDELFWQMARQEEITLSEEEESTYQSRLDDVWSDLTDEGKEIMLGVGYEDIQESLYKMIFAQKMQTIYAALQNADYDQYNFATDAYKDLLEAQDIQIVEDVWGRVDFGNVTLNH